MTVSFYYFCNSRTIKKIWKSSNSLIERPTISGHVASTHSKSLEKSLQSENHDEFNEEERRFYANKLVSDNLENFFEPEFPESLAKTINERLSDNSFDPPKMAEATVNPTMQNILFQVKNRKYASRMC